MWAGARRSRPGHTPFARPTFLCLQRIQTSKSYFPDTIFASGGSMKTFCA